MSEPAPRYVEIAGELLHKTERELRELKLARLNEIRAVKVRFPQPSTGGMRATFGTPPRERDIRSRPQGGC